MAETVVKIQPFILETIPDRILTQLEEGGFEPKKNALIMVKTIIASEPPVVRYQADNIDNQPDGLINYMRELARQDGIDLNKVFAEDEPISVSHAEVTSIEGPPKWAKQPESTL